MKLGALLSDIKGKQSRLSRLMSISKETMYVEVGKTPKMDYKEVSAEIERLVKEIRLSKLKIQEANMKNKLPDYDMSIAEAIMKVGDLRSLIAYKSGLIRYSKTLSWDREEINIEYNPQVEEKKIEKEIEELSKEKIKLDNAIQKANWSVEVN
jgi:flagellar biosynthesis/type III secretory pathway chaperone